MGQVASRGMAARRIRRDLPDTCLPGNESPVQRQNPLPCSGPRRLLNWIAVHDCPHALGAQRARSEVQVAVPAQAARLLGTQSEALEPDNGGESVPLSDGLEAGSLLVTPQFVCRCGLLWPLHAPARVLSNEPLIEGVVDGEPEDSQGVGNRPGAQPGPRPAATLAALRLHPRNETVDVSSCQRLELSVAETFPDRPEAMSGLRPSGIFKVARVSCIPGVEVGAGGRATTRDVTPLMHLPDDPGVFGDRVFPPVE